MKYLHKISLLALLLTSQAAHSQSLKSVDDENKSPFISLSKDTVSLPYDAGFNSVAILSNQSSYNIEKTTTDADWVSYRKEENGNITFFSTYYYDNTTPRYATFKISTPDASASRNLVVKQQVNTSASEIGDTQVEIKSGTASSSQSGEGIEYSFDGDASTIWHSVWSGTSFPITVTYTFAEASHIDYMVYTPRTDNVNGRWGNITIYYATSAAPSKWVKITDYDCEKSSSPSTISFGDSGYDDVIKVKIEINSADSDGSKNYASCAEIAFYTKDQSFANDIATYFTDNLCTQLKDGVSVSSITNPYLRQLATALLAGDYSTEFRLGEFGCFLTRSTLISTYKTSCGYDPYENPTGIYFEEGDKIVVFADGIDSSYPVSLCIKCFSNANDISTEGQPVSYYPLSNGANVITASNRGNAYVSYYSDDYANAPTVKLHFAMATESGYFDPSKHTNSDYQRFLKSAKSDIFDFYTQRAHVAVPISNLKSVCPKDAEKLALIYDSVIYREREIMGLPQLNKEMKNHQFAQPVASGMYADGTGANAAFGSFNEWCNPSDFGFWGFGHELGHNNQITPGFKWSGCGETTNNIYSSWVEHKVGAKTAYGDGYHRLEDEYSGIDTYTNTRGGRFEAYLEEGVRKGVSWQLQDGPDYNGTEATSTTVKKEDANGNVSGTITTTSRNYDHFLKVIPFWQLSLYTEEVGAAPTTWGKVIETYRTDFNSSTYNTCGKQQIEFMRRFCIQSGINFLPFFEKAGLLKTISAYIEDYTAGWLIINETMISNLKSEIEAKGYPECPEGLNYINAYNYKRFRDKVALTEQTVGTGCSMSGSNRVKVDNDAWPGAVGYETYDASGNLLHISMFGLGADQMSSRYTYVLFPSSESPSYVMAVGYDGTRVKIFQK